MNCLNGSGVDVRKRVRYPATNSSFGVLIVPGLTGCAYWIEPARQRRSWRQSVNTNVMDEKNLHRSLYNFALQKVRPWQFFRGGGREIAAEKTICGMSRDLPEEPTRVRIPIAVGTLRGVPGKIATPGHGRF